MAEKDDDSPDSEKSGDPGWLSLLKLAGAVGAVGAFVGLALHNEQKKDRQAADLVDHISGLMGSERMNRGKVDESADPLVAAVSNEVSAKIEDRIDERVERRLEAADARFNRRIDQISDSAASAVEQVLRVGTHCTDEVIQEAEERLAHIGWLDDAVAPATDDASRGATDDDDPVWADLSDFQRQFDS